MSIYVTWTPQQSRANYTQENEQVSFLLLNAKTGKSTKNKKLRRKDWRHLPFVVRNKWPPKLFSQQMARVLTHISSRSIGPKNISPCFTTKVVSIEWPQNFFCGKTGSISPFTQQEKTKIKAITNPQGHGRWPR